ncbi:MAG TPA: DUF4383 domain-containing protein [Allosphingosinicella sp.]|uniref:DUF4383 domain-containing protein n=1 Tax=Allosphingosinicella sp. TaxID=2823234 RepID=UPI002ED8DCB0
MSTRTFALVFGIVFLLITASGLIPGLLQHRMHDGVAVDAMSGDALGLFPVNLVHTLVHLLFGVWGLAASRSLGAAKGYAKAVGIAYVILMIMGLVPGLDTMFGMAPLYGNDVWLHLLLALGGIYFGWIHKDRVADRRA